MSALPAAHKLDANRQSQNLNSLRHRWTRPCASDRAAVQSPLANALCNTHAVALRVHLEDLLVTEDNPVRVEPVGLGKHTSKNETCRDLQTSLMKGHAVPR